MDKPTDDANDPSGRARGMQSSGLTAQAPTLNPNDHLADFDGGRPTPARRRAMIMIALGEYLDGYDLIAIAGALLQLNVQFHLTASQTGLLGASSFFGATLGLLVAGSVADRIGRRTIFVQVFWLFAILAGLSALVMNFAQLFAVRFLLGVCIGADIAISIPFLAEISPRKSRGRWAGAVPQIAWTLGAMSSLAMAAVLITIAGEHAWRWLFGFGVVPALIILVGRHSVPESPRWLVSQGHFAEADAAMRAFGLETSVSARDETQPALETEARARGSYLDIFRAPHTRRAVFVITVLGIGPLVGSAASVAAPYVMHFVGDLGAVTSLGGSILIWIGGFVGSIIAFLTVDRLGRFRSTAIAFWGSATCLILLTLTVKVPVLFVATYTLYGVCVWFGSSSNWLLPTELLPTHLRARAQGLGSGASRLMAGFTTWLVPTGVEAVGFAPTFLALSVVGVVLGGFVLMNRRYESKGKSLDEALE
ncbi:MAG: MFS transporter [Alphaproteobacteria bacterium]|nr:MFS transporter [Alphaproteobacteria bacterium]